MTSPTPTALQHHRVGGDDSDEVSRMPPPARQSTIILDTLGKLHARGYGMFGACLDCSALYQMSAPAAERISGCFDIDMDALVAERGAGASCIRMQPLPCPRCGGRRTECRITMQGRGGYVGGPPCAGGIR